MSNEEKQPEYFDIEEEIPEDIQEDLQKKVAYGEMAKMILIVEAMTLFLVVIAATLHYGIAPTIEYLQSIIVLSDYQRGVVDTIQSIMLIIAIIWVLLETPARL